MNTKKDIRDSKHYESMPAKFDRVITIVDGEKNIDEFPKDGYKKITTDQTTNKPNLAIRTGKINGIIVIDLDNPKEGEYDGIKHFEANICPIKNLNTLVTRSIRGGYHIYYRYNSTLKGQAKLKILDRTYSIDIRNDGNIIFEGEGYELLNDPENLAEIPKEFLDLYKREEKRIVSDKRHMGEKYLDTGIQLLLDNLADNYVNIYSDWISVMIVLKNIDCPFPIALEFSKKSKHKKDNIESYVEKIWNGLEKRNTPTIGSLISFVKQNPTLGINAYDGIIKKVKKELKKDDNVTSGDISDINCYKLFSKLYNDNRFFTNEYNELYFCNKFGIWKPINTKSKHFYKGMEDYIQYLLENEIKYPLENYTKRLQFKGEVLTYLQKEDYELNPNPYLFPFNNGVYDLEQKVFRVASPAELVTISCGYDYKYESSERANDFYKDVIIDDDNREYLLSIIASHLAYVRPRQEFFCLYNKRGNNGKSTMTNVNAAMFGNLSAEIKSDVLLISNRNVGEGTSSFLCNMENKRYISFQEIRSNDKLCQKQIKTLTGGDKISVRDLNKTAKEIMVNGMLVLSCNNQPAVDSFDGGTKRRIRNIEMTTEFVENPTEPHHRKIKDIITKELRYSMFQLLIEHYREIKPGIENCPQKIRDATEKYFNTKDSLTRFITDYIEYCPPRIIEGKTFNEHITRQQIKNKITSQDICQEYGFKGKSYKDITQQICDHFKVEIIDQKKINGKNSRGVILDYKWIKQDDEYQDESSMNESDLSMTSLNKDSDI